MLSLYYIAFDMEQIYSFFQFICRSLLIQKLALSKLTVVLMWTFIFQGILFGQYQSNITKSGWGKYTYQNQTKKLHKFKSELTQDPVTSDFFTKFNNPRKAQIIANSVAAGLAAGTVGLTVAVADESALGAVIVILLGGAGTGVVLGLGNLLTGPRKAKAKRELIKHINLMEGNPESSTVKNLEYATPITYHEIDDLYSLNSVTNKFHLLGSEIKTDNYSTAEFENYLILKNRQQRALLFSYILGGTALGSELLNQTGVVDEDTARGDAHLFLTRYLPIAAALGSVGFSFAFAKRKNVSKEKLIQYINGTHMSYQERTSQWNLLGGITQNGLTLSLRF